MRKILGLFKKKKVKEDLKNMDKCEKKKFLSNDFIDRMIRVEQRVGSSLGDYVPYHKTNYYKSLSDSEKKSYNSYIKRRGLVKVLALLPFFGFLVLIGLLNFEFTGNVVKEEVEGLGLDVFIIPFFVFISWFYIVSFLVRKVRDSNMEKYFDVIDEISLNRSLA